jgi:DNA-binding LacI/PurR family transcriptional regulator
MSPSPASAAPRRGLRVALLAAYLDNEYEWAICKGVRGAVEAAGGSVLYVAGAGLSDPNPGHQARASLYDLVDSSTADAILSVSGVVGHFIGTVATGAWLQKFGLPVASVGIADGVPSVSIDDARGIVQLIEHLVLQHDRKREQLGGVEALGSAHGG